MRNKIWNIAIKEREIYNDKIFRGWDALEDSNKIADSVYPMNNVCNTSHAPSSFK